MNRRRVGVVARAAAAVAVAVGAALVVGPTASWAQSPEPVTEPPGPTVPAECPAGPGVPRDPATGCALPPYGCPGGPAGPAAPGTRCPDGSVPTPPVAPPGCPGGLADPPEPGTICPDGSVPRDSDADRQLRNILGLDEAGESHPLEAYDIGCDEGSWNAFVRKMWCGAQALPFAVGKWTVGLGIDIVSWALEFRIAEALAPIAGLLSRVYDTSLIGPIGLRHFAWTMALVVGGWHLLRSRTARGVSEIASTFAIATVGVFVLANPDGYLRGSMTAARNSSGAVLEAVDGTLHPDQAQGPDAIGDRLSGVLRRSFVAEPYDLINWGAPLTGECAAARDEILAGGPWGGSDEPRDIMRDHGCDAEADYNENPTDSRASASLIVAAGSIVATVLLVLVAIGVFVAQVTLVFLFAAASLCWALAMFPGARGVLWWWIGKLVAAIGGVIGATFMLSWLAVSLTAVLDATADVSIVQRCWFSLLVIAVAFKIRTQISRALDGIGRRVGDHLARASGQPNQWPSLLAAGAAGAGLSSIARNWARDVPGGQYAMNRAYMRMLGRGYRHGGRGGRGGGRFGGRRGVVGRGRATVQGAVAAGRTGARVAGRTARGVALAPIVVPQLYQTGHRRVTTASTRARQALAGARTAARATGRHLSFNTAHPVIAMRGAHAAAVAAQHHRNSPRPTRRPPARPAAGRPGSGPRPTPPPQRSQGFVFTTPDGSTVTHHSGPNHHDPAPDQ